MSLKDDLAANTERRMQVMERDDYDAIDAAIRDLVAGGVGGDAPQVGDAAPPFTLADANDQPVALADHLARGAVVLAFYRGGWCSYCNFQLRAFQGALDEIRSLGGELVGVTPERPDETVTTAERLALSHPVLSDPGNATARAYGLEFVVDEGLRPIYRKLGVDLEAINGDAAYRLPVPGTFVIGRNGRIAWRFVDADYRRRAEPSDVLAALRALNAE